MVSPPRHEAELLQRALALRGESIEALSLRFGLSLEGAPVATKGKVGELLERALGATGGSGATWDFPALRVELKTVPMGASGVPRESTFVCSVPLADADRAEWDESWVRAKLARVLWVPIVEDAGDGGPDARRARRVGNARLWSPSAAQESVLASDFEEILGRVGAGGIEGLSAHVGRWLQLRPKAAHGGVRTEAPGRDGARVSTVPRGFYLRARFTGAILADPGALP